MAATELLLSRPCAPSPPRPASRCERGRTRDLARDAGAVCLSIRAKHTTPHRLPLSQCYPLGRAVDDTAGQHGSKSRGGRKSTRSSTQALYTHVLNPLPSNPPTKHHHLTFNLMRCIHTNLPHPQAPRPPTPSPPQGRRIWAQRTCSNDRSSPHPTRLSPSPPLRCLRSCLLPKEPLLSLLRQLSRPGVTLALCPLSPPLPPACQHCRTRTLFRTQAARHKLQHLCLRVQHR